MELSLCRLCSLGCGSDSEWGFDDVGRRVLEKLEIMVGLFSVSVWWQGLGDGFIWACSGVYGPNDNILRGQMWDELIGIQQL